MYKIEKFIEMPAIIWKYPFPSMEVGDSFFVPGDRRKSISSAASWAGKRHGKKFICRKVNDGYRVWRAE